MFDVISGVLADTLLLQHTVTILMSVSMLVFGLLLPVLVARQLSGEEALREDSTGSHP